MLTPWFRPLGYVLITAVKNAWKDVREDSKKARVQCGSESAAGKTQGKKMGVRTLEEDIATWGVDLNDKRTSVQVVGDWKKEVASVAPKDAVEANLPSGAGMIMWKAAGCIIGGMIGGVAGGITGGDIGAVLGSIVGGCTVWWAVGFRPKWFKMLPEHLRPDLAKIKILEDLRKRYGFPDEMLAAGISQSEQSTLRTQRLVLEQSRARMPNGSEKDLWACVLTSRANSAVFSGTKPMDTDEIVRILDNAKSFEDICEAIINHERSQRIPDISGIQGEIDALL